MAGLYITTKTINDEEAAKIFSTLAFTDLDWKSELKEEKLNFILSRVDKKNIWAPAQNDDEQIQVCLSGRIALDKVEWNKGLNGNNKGGLACSYIINEYLDKGLQITNELNGTYLILIIDKKKQQNLLITDKMGFYPAFYFICSEFISITTNFDSITKVVSNINYDLDTMAEMLKFGYSVHPNTYFKEIKQLDPASIYAITKNGIRKLKQYWELQPKFEFKQSKKELITDLSYAIKNAVKKRTQEFLGSTGLFLSAGADSRSILSGAENRSKAISFTFFDVQNNEYNLAKRIAEAYNSQHIGLKRDPEYYGLGAKFAAKVISGLWNITDAHYTNFLLTLNKYNIDNYLSGCFADFLFKGIAFNRKPVKLFNKNLPFYELDSFKQEWYFHVSEFFSKYNNLAQKRNLSAYQDIDLNLNNELTQWKIEKARLSPISREATFGSRQFLLRTLPWDPVLADNDLLEMFQKIPPRWKINGVVWKKAVYQIASEVRNIVDNNNLAPLNYNKFGVTIKFCEGILRRKITGKDVDGTSLNTVITRGSWPNLYYYLKSSKILNDLWSNNTVISVEIFNEILGYNPYDYSTIEWADKDINLFFRLLTLKLWLESNRL